MQYQQVITVNKHIETLESQLKCLDEKMEPLMEQRNKIVKRIAMAKNYQLVKERAAELMVEVNKESPTKLTRSDSFHRNHFSSLVAIDDTDAPKEALEDAITQDLENATAAMGVIGVFDTQKKVVINKAFGGFDLSEEAAKIYTARTGLSVRGGDEFKRDDPVLVSIVETMKELANGKYSSLSIVEIPADVAWEIEEYDGAEWVAEKHRVWS